MFCHSKFNDIFRNDPPPKKGSTKWLWCFCLTLYGWPATETCRWPTDINTWNLIDLLKKGICSELLLWLYGAWFVDKNVSRGENILKLQLMRARLLQAVSYRYHEISKPPALALLLMTFIPFSSQFPLIPYSYYLTLESGANDYTAKCWVETEQQLLSLAREMQASTLNCISWERHFRTIVQSSLCFFPLNEEFSLHRLIFWSAKQKPRNCWPIGATFWMFPSAISADSESQYFHFNGHNSVFVALFVVQSLFKLCQCHHQVNHH